MTPSRRPSTSSWRLLRSNHLRIPGNRAPRSRLPALVSWCALAAGVDIILYISYFAHQHRFRWLTHLFVGSSVALLVMSVVAWRTGRPVRLPLVWLIVGHLFGIVPDLLFKEGAEHRRWMDVFLGHLSTHFVPGHNWTWYTILLASLALYLWVSRRKDESRWLHQVFSLDLNACSRETPNVPDQETSGGRRSLEKII